MNNWIEHTNNSGQACAKCVVCGWNSSIRNIGTDRECLNCEDLADNARLAEAKVARWETMNAALPIVDIDNAPSAFAALTDTYFGK